MKKRSKEVPTQGETPPLNGGEGYKTAASYKPGSIMNRIALMLEQGADYNAVRTKLKLANNFAFYKVRREMGLSKGAKREARQKADAIIRIEAIFHGVDGEVMRVLASPDRFMVAYAAIMGTKPKKQPTKGEPVDGN
jgi:hypothetical protein